MATEIMIQKTGYEMEEAKILEWLKKEGDRVEEDEPLVIIETEKSTVEMPAPCSGVLRKILVPDEQVAQVGEIIGIIAEPEEDIDVLLTELSTQKEALPSREEALERLSTIKNEIQTLAPQRVTNGGNNDT